MTSYDEALVMVLKFEGGYVNDPADHGGATNHGITQAVYDAYRHSMSEQPQSVHLCTDSEVSDIYHNQYWIPARCDDIAKISTTLAKVHFDSAVNMGTYQAAKFLQRTVGSMPDGKIGPQTLLRLSQVTDKVATVAKYLDIRQQFYVYIISSHPDQIKFLAGWTNRVNRLKAL